MKTRFDVAVVGGGASGLAAAISAARRGARTVICERLPRLGRKILATGGGRCNLSNLDLTCAHYTSSSKPLVSAVLSRFGPDRIHEFFGGLGLETIEEEGRIFPVTNQAATVLKVLEMEIRRLNVALELGFETVDLKPDDAGFVLTAGDGRGVASTMVILAGGGRAYPALGSNGSCYALARRLGHHIVPPVPSAVPLLAKDRMCHMLQGQRVKAKATAVVGGETARSAAGDVLFAPYGLSGTAVLDVSESLSIALNREGRTDTAVILDLVPFLSLGNLTTHFAKRLASGWAPEDLISGILPEKFGAVASGLLTSPVRDHDKAAEALAAELKRKRLRIFGTRGWNEAEFTSGGIDASEVRPRTLESKLQKGVYLAGEILDVQGTRGGYNLAWAWASGSIAGLTE